MTPNEVRAWQRVIRDFLTTAVGVFMLVFETVGAAEPNEWLIGAGLTAIGLVPLFRYDEWRATRYNNGDPARTDLRKGSDRRRRATDPGDDEDFEERWTHLP